MTRLFLYLTGLDWIGDWIKLEKKDGYVEHSIDCSYQLIHDTRYGIV